MMDRRPSRSRVALGWAAWFRLERREQPGSQTTGGTTSRQTGSTNADPFCHSESTGSREWRVELGRLGKLRQLNCRAFARACACVLAGFALFALLVLFPQSTQAAPSGLVAAYAFDEGSGTSVSDSSGNGNTGTVSGATWVSSGKFGKALSFNGSSALVSVPDAASLHFGSALTLEAWVNPSAVSSAWRDVIYKGNDAVYLEVELDWDGQRSRRRRHVRGAGRVRGRLLGVGGEHLVVSRGDL